MYEFCNSETSNDFSLIAQRSTSPFVTYNYMVENMVFFVLPSSWLTLIFLTA
jgi:hypothetical protein